jgi:TRAP-type C4-dicarboxylate transport system permease small subunit
MARGDAARVPEPSGSAAGLSGERENIFSISLDWRRWWTIVPEIVALLCAGALPIVVMTNVVARYTDWFHVIWATDVVKVLFLWLTFLGGALAVKYEAHVRMSTLSDRFAAHGKAGGAWDLAIRLSPISIGLLLVVLGVPLVEITMVRELQTLRISAGYFMPIVPVSGALMIVYALLSLFRGGLSPIAPAARNN